MEKRERGYRMTGKAVSKMTKTESMTLTGVFTAITGVLAWISIPLPFTPVPINMALVGVLLGSAIMGRKGSPRGGAASVGIYLLMGAIGIPVFSGGTAGLGVLTGPTGGFLIGYLATALFVGYLGNRKSLAVSALMNMLGILCCYAFGLIWFMQLTGSSLMAGISACMLPFLPGDVLKSILAAYLGRKIR